MLKKIKYLFTDKLLVNFLHILSGDAIASILSIFSISFITRGIGLKSYGFIVLIQGIVSLIDGFLNFQSWQGYIKFFPEVKEKREKILSLTKFSYVLDIVTALGAFIVFFILSKFFISFYSFNEIEKKLLFIFSIYVIFNIQGTPIGILRSFDRFDYLRNQRVIVGVVNFILLGIGFFLKFGVSYFVYTYMAINIFGAILLNLYALKILKDMNIKIIEIFKVKWEFNKEFFKFTCLTNLNSSLDIPVQYLDNLLIGKFLTLEELGIYKLCKSLAIILDKVGAPIYQTLYPYFCELNVKKEYFSMIKKALKISGILGIICSIAIIGMNIIGFWLVGEIFTQAIRNYKLEVNCYMFVKTLATLFITIHPLFLALGYIKKETKIVFISNCIYLITLFTFIQKLGLIGVILAYGLQVAFIGGLKLLVILRNIKY